jgi:hypothetical protein
MAKMTSLVGKYVIVRTQSAGVFAGTLVAREAQEAELTDARRLWYWAGAASLSQLANVGTSKPGSCKFPAPVALVQLTQVIELLIVSDAARTNLEAVPEWKS